MVKIFSCLLDLGKITGAGTVAGDDGENNLENGPK